MDNWRVGDFFNLLVMQVTQQTVTMGCFTYLASAFFVVVAFFKGH